MFNKPVTVTKNGNSVSIGSFLLAAMEMGIFKSLDEAASQVEIAHTCGSSENQHNTYMKFFEIFESLSYKLPGKFEKIAELQ